MYKSSEKVRSTSRRTLTIRQIVGSLNVGIATAALIHKIVDKAKFSTFEQLVGIIRDVGRLLIAANPKGELVFRISADGRTCFEQCG